MVLSFTAVGEVMLDLEVTSGQHAHAGRIRGFAGGTAANAAVWAASAGADATCVGRIGADAAGLGIRAALIASGVRAALAVDPVEPTGTVALVDGELVVDRGANRMLDIADLAALDADVVLVSGYALLSEGSARAAAAAVASADWSSATAGSAALLGRAPDALIAALCGARLVVANRAESTVLTGKDDPQEAALVLGERCEFACVTIGGEGALLAVRGTTYRSRERPSAEVAARGAGDALAATLALALARGDSPGGALELACDAGRLAAESASGWP